MTTTTFSDTGSRPSTKLAVAGLGGGLVFGILMGMMGMFPMVGMLIRVENAVVGFIVHMIISAILGAIFGLTAGQFTASWSSAVVLGIVYGVITAILFIPLVRRI